MVITEQIQKNVAQLPPGKQIQVLDFVTFLLQRRQAAGASAPNAERAKRIRRSLGNLAKMKTFADIVDPVEWQTSIRKDRPLPGREQ